MTEKDNLGFREWTAHYEKEQEADREKLNSIVDTVGTLSVVVHRMSASVEALTENQKGMFSRMNRPWQWGVVMAVFMALFSMAGMFGIMANLIVSPITDVIAAIQTDHDRDVSRDLTLHMWFRETIANMQVSDAKADAEIEWLGKMEERLNSRIHRAVEATQ